LDASSTGSATLRLGAGSSGSSVQGLVFVKGISVFNINSSNNIIAGNFIGVDTDGVTFVGTNGFAISVSSGTGNTIGGPSPAARNLIASGNDNLLIDGDATVVQGNYFDTNAAGTAALPLSGHCIDVELGNGTIIGGPGAGNLFGSWTSGAVNVSQVNLNFPLSNVVVQGNLIGTNATGTARLAPGLAGIEIGRGTNFTIGGSAPGAGNVISGAGSGINVVNSPTGVVIQGNKIGTDSSGTVAIGNATTGINVVGSPSSGLIGGTAAGQGNLIAFNGTQGVSIANGNNGWSILGNSIHSNLGLGISLGGRPDLLDIPTPNDPCDADAGPNNLQNYPVIKSFTNTSGSVNITGTLNSTANTTFRLEFFRSDVIDPTGFGEGQFFLGSANVTTDGTCNGSFNVNFPITSKALRVTATATDPLGNTSEFSAAVGQLLNISTRLRVQTGQNVLIGGFIISGTDPKKVIVRGIGPSLAGFFSDFLADPTLELHDASRTLATNDDWKVRPDGSSQQAEIDATHLAPTNDRESALISTLPANNAGYTAIVQGKTNTTGIGVVEAYDLDDTTNSKLANISTRGLVETGNNVLIGGFIPGNGVTTVIAIALGPSLTNFGITNPLLDPTLELHDSNGNTLRRNDNWKIREDGSSQQAEIEATHLQPTSDQESALIQTLPPGGYTAIVSGVNNTTGIAVVEVFSLN
jgi:hypothetical protein